jgi:hypothetical protein
LVGLVFSISQAEDGVGILPGICRYNERPGQRCDPYSAGGDGGQHRREARFIIGRRFVEGPIKRRVTDRPTARGFARNRSSWHKESPRPLRRSACPVTPLTEVPGAKYQPQGPVGSPWNLRSSRRPACPTPLFQKCDTPGLTGFYKISREFSIKPDMLTKKVLPDRLGNHAQAGPLATPALFA